MTNTLKERDVFVPPCDAKPDNTNDHENPTLAEIAAMDQSEATLRERGQYALWQTVEFYD